MEGSRIDVLRARFQTKFPPQLLKADPTLVAIRAARLFDERGKPWVMGIGLYTR